MSTTEQQRSRSSEGTSGAGSYASSTSFGSSLGTRGGALFGSLGRRGQQAFVVSSSGSGGIGGGGLGTSATSGGGTNFLHAQRTYSHTLQQGTPTPSYAARSRLAAVQAREQQAARVRAQTLPASLNLNVPTTRGGPPVLGSGGGDGGGSGAGFGAPVVLRQNTEGSVFSAALGAALRSSPARDKPAGALGVRRRRPGSKDLFQAASASSTTTTAGTSASSSRSIFSSDSGGTGAAAAAATVAAKLSPQLGVGFGADERAAMNAAAQSNDARALAETEAMMDDVEAGVESGLGSLRETEPLMNPFRPVEIGKGAINERLNANSVYSTNRWRHIFTEKQSNSLRRLHGTFEMDVKSLCEPAILPITTDFIPSEAELATQ